MKLSIVAGATSQIVLIFIQDSSVTTTVAGLTGLTNASSGLVCYRARKDDGNAGGTQITLNSATRGTFTSGGFVEKDATNMPGWYEFGIPNTAIATGSRWCCIEFKGATNMVPVLVEIELTGWDNQDATAGGISRIDAAISSRATVAGIWQDTTAGDFTVAASIGKSIMNGVGLGTGLTIVSVSGSVGSIASGGITSSSFAAGAIDASAIATDAIGSAELAASAVNEIVTAVWTDLLAGGDFSTSASIGKLLKDDIDAAISSRMATYTQPTGFLAATFPTTVASTTNITSASGVTLTSGERNSIADALLTRDVVNVEGTANDHSLCYVVLASSEWSVSGTTLTVKKTDGSTTFATKTLSKTPGDDPVRGAN